jgi:hypothetical protein
LIIASPEKDGATSGVQDLVHGRHSSGSGKLGNQADEMRDASTTVMAPPSDEIAAMEDADRGRGRCGWEASRRGGWMALMRPRGGADGQTGEIVHRAG